MCNSLKFTELFKSDAADLPSDAGLSAGPAAGQRGRYRRLDTHARGCRSSAGSTVFNP